MAEKGKVKWSSKHNVKLMTLIVISTIGSTAFLAFNYEPWKNNFTSYVTSIDSLDMSSNQAKVLLDQPSLLVNLLSPAKLKLDTASKKKMIDLSAPSKTIKANALLASGVESFSNQSSLVHTSSSPMKSSSSTIGHDSHQEFLTSHNYMVEKFEPSTLAFIHIPKNSGTAIELLGKRNGIKWGKWDTSNRIQVTPRNVCSRWHRIPTGVATGTKAFCVMRDPVDRLMSQIKWQLLRSRSAKYLKKCPDVEELNWFPQKYARVGRQQDCHYIPQVEYIRHCDHILRFSHLANDFEKLMKLYGLDHLRLEDQKDVNNSTAYLLERFHDCPMDKLTKDYLTEMSMKIIRRYYDHDYRILSELDESTVFRKSEQIRSIIESYKSQDQYAYDCHKQVCE
mmetsp:Transcript_19592/g.29233  ORF Transcript_19592/g.29233 Transcript_19592/m.29233 type:complete len:394 (+) Transcript_19592:72-1253(+)